MSDLISRSELIKHFETIQLQEDAIGIDFVAIIDEIKEQPTAYDIDGVSTDVCEWKKSKDYPFDWIVGCDGCEVNHRQGDYCPRCGKKIKVVE